MNQEMRRVEELQRENQLQALIEAQGNLWFRCFVRFRALCVRNSDESLDLSGADDIRKTMKFV